MLNLSMLLPAPPSACARMGPGDPRCTAGSLCPKGGTLHYRDQPRWRHIPEGGIRNGENTTHVARLHRLLCTVHRADHPWYHRCLPDLAERDPGDAGGIHEGQRRERADLPGEYGVLGPGRVYSGDRGRAVSQQRSTAAAADAPLLAAG